MAHVYFWIVVGIIAGLLAKRLIPAEPGGVIGNLMIGVMGALAGGWLFNLVLGSTYPGWIGSTIVAFMGAVALLFTLRAVTRQPTA